MPAEQTTNVTLRRQRAVYRHTLALVSCLAWPLIAGCGGLKTLFQTPLHRADDMLTQAIRDITNKNDRWESNVKQLQKNLPKEAQDIIGNELTSLTTHAVELPIIEVKCGAARIGRSASVLRHLKSMRARLNNKQEHYIFPDVCYAESLNLDVADSRHAKVSLYGYDLDATSPDPKGDYELHLYNPKTRGEWKLQTNHIGAKQRYKLTIDTSGQRFKNTIVNHHATVIRVLWGGKRVAEIPVTLPSSDVVRDSPPLSGVTLYLTKPNPNAPGDFDTSDSSPMSWGVQVSAKAEGSTFSTQITFTASGDPKRRDAPTYTTSTGWKPTYTDNSGRDLHLTSSRFFADGGNITDHNPMVRDYGEVSLVKRLTVYGDQHGIDVPGYTRILVEFNSPTFDIQAQPSLAMEPVSPLYEPVPKSILVKLHSFQLFKTTISDEPTPANGEPWDIKAAFGAIVLCRKNEDGAARVRAISGTIGARPKRFIEDASKARLYSLEGKFFSIPLEPDDVEIQVKIPVEINNGTTTVSYKGNSDGEVYFVLQKVLGWEPSHSDAPAFFVRGALGSDPGGLVFVGRLEVTVDPIY